MRAGRILISLLLVFVLPVVLQCFFQSSEQHVVKQEISETVSMQTEGDEQEMTIRVLHEGRIINLDLDDYVCAVLMAEMPASFESEALKAQAVAIRTYTLRKIHGTQKHPDADICTNNDCCQAYKSLENSENTESGRKVRTAVLDTIGQVLLYDHELIDATYFSSSGGRTESAVAVWGMNVPYLQAKDSPEEDAKYYRDQVSFDESEILSLLGFSNSIRDFTYKDITYTDGYGVDTINICGTMFTGIELRHLLNLRSTAFDIKIAGDTITFITRGYGHRVGLSQYGAQSMAQKGNNYQQILAYYYPDTELMVLDHEDLYRLFDKEMFL